MNANGLILWLIAGTGVLFIYAAYKNETPQAIINRHISGKSTQTVDRISTYSGKSAQQAAITPVAQTSPSTPPAATNSGGLIYT